MSINWLGTEPLSHSSNVLCVCKREFILFTLWAFSINLCFHRRLLFFHLCGLCWVVQPPWPMAGARYERIRKKERRTTQKPKRIRTLKLVSIAAIKDRLKGEWKEMIAFEAFKSVSTKTPRFIQHLPRFPTFEPSQSGPISPPHPTRTNYWEFLSLSAFRSFAVKKVSEIQVSSTPLITLVPTQDTENV